MEEKVSARTAQKAQLDLQEKIRRRQSVAMRSKDHKMHIKAGKKVEQQRKNDENEYVIVKGLIFRCDV